MEKLKMESIDMIQKNIVKIETLFPNVITEIRDENGKLKKAVNFELLKQELLGEVIDGEECYDFTWVGKKTSIVEGNTPIRKTLRPCIEESKDWENTGNLYIEGDNLDALKLMQESYLNSIKMIYIDPPYNTGNDFIYKDSFIIEKDEYDKQIGLYDDDENRLFQNTENNGRYHSDWCSMIYPRLKLSHNLLSDDGLIFISIGREEVSNLVKICDEIFGESNKLSVIGRVAKTASNNGTHFAPSLDFVLCYAKEKSKIDKLYDKVDETLYKKVETQGKRKGEKYRDDVAFFQSSQKDLRPNQKYFIECPDGSRVLPPCSIQDEIMREGDGRWRWSKERYLKDKDLLVFKQTKTSPLVDENGNKAKWNIYTKSYLSDRQEEGTLPRDIWNDFINRKGADLLKKLGIPFDFSKPVELVHYMMYILRFDTGIVLDFFSGSATTAHAAMLLNAEDGGDRKFIMVQLPEKCNENSKAFKVGYKNICEIGKERIRRAGEKIKSEIEERNSKLGSGEEPNKIPDIGFRVLKIDSTNMKDVYYSANEYNQSVIASLESNIKEDRTDLDLLYGVLHDWGLPLSLQHKIEEIEGITVHTVDEGSLIACFEEKVPEEVVREIAKRQPLRVVFRDSSFADSPDKINVEEIFKLLAPNTTVKVI